MAEPITKRGQQNGYHKGHLKSIGERSSIVVFADAELDSAVKLCAKGIFLPHDHGHRSSTRTFVEAAVYDDFVKRVKRLAEQSPLQEGPSLGELDTLQVEKFLRYVEQGKKEGARLVCGGEKHANPHGGGFYVEPTVFANVKEGMKSSKEEIFGPVMSIIKFDGPEDLVKQANKMIGGLAVGLLTNNINKALLVANNIRASHVWMNCFFGCADDPIAPLRDVWEWE